MTQYFLSKAWPARVLRIAVLVAIGWWFAKDLVYAQSRFFREKRIRPDPAEKSGLCIHTRRIYWQRWGEYGTPCIISSSPRVSSPSAWKRVCWRYAIGSISTISIKRRKRLPS